MAVPKGKVSKARRDKRRSAVWKLNPQNVPRVRHVQWPSGQGRGVQRGRVIAIKAEVSQETSAFLY